MPNKNALNWHEELGQAIASELELSEGSGIDHQGGTVWVTDLVSGECIAITGVKTEE